MGSKGCLKIIIIHEDLAIQKKYIFCNLIKDVILKVKNKSLSKKLNQIE